MTKIKLTDLNPSWVGSGGEGITKNGNPVPRREGIGITFDCPCGCESPVFVYLENPLDGNPAFDTNTPKWCRHGDDFETLTLSPSLLRRGGCGTHGWVRHGYWEFC